MNEPLKRYAEANVPTEYGLLRTIVYRVGEVEHLALVHGDVSGREGVHVRVHSECLTGEVLHSLKCDCREQLDYALKHIFDEDAGIVVYLRQEGRGIGLGNKIKAYALQSKGADTVDANRMLGFEDDSRTYEVAADILRDLDVRSVVLLTNNPLKMDALKKDGVPVVDRHPVYIVKRYAGSLHRFLVHRHDGEGVLTRRDFGDDSAVAAVDVYLRCDNVGQDACAIFDHRSCGLVARCFEGQDSHQNRFRRCGRSRK